MTHIPNAIVCYNKFQACFDNVQNPVAQDMQNRQGFIRSKKVQLGFQVNALKRIKHSNR